MSLIPLFLVVWLFTNSLAEDCDSNWEGYENFDTTAERVYYVACVEEEWNYAPSGKNLVSNVDITADSEAGTWLYGPTDERIGATYIKTLYRAYTDNCFTDKLDLGAEFEHLGSIGPPIRAIVGENIKIFYENTCSISTSMHPHGVKYEKNSEGGYYHDDDGINGGDSVETDGQWIYIWTAREGITDESSNMWIYHSHRHEIGDIHGGLVGPIIITKQGMACGKDDDLKPKDIDREFVTFFVLFDENLSPMFDKNVGKYLPQNVDSELFEDEEFIESNLMHGINGFLFGNLDDLICKNGEKVRWYTASFGNELDGPHSPHWHGNVLFDSTGTGVKDTLVLIPGTTWTATMTVDSVGIWLFHCHVFDHIAAGMITTYTVLPDESTDESESNDKPQNANANHYDFDKFTSKSIQFNSVRQDVILVVCFGVIGLISLMVGIWIGKIWKKSSKQ